MNHVIFANPEVINTINLARKECQNRTLQGDIDGIVDYRNRLIQWLGEDDGILVFNHRAHLRPIIPRKFATTG